MEMDRRGLRAGHGCKRGRLVSAAIFLLLVQLAVVAQRSRCCCDVFPPPPHAFGRRLGMCSANCVRKVYGLQVFISGDHWRQMWCDDLTPDLQIQIRSMLLGDSPYRIHHSSLNFNNNSSINQKDVGSSEKTTKTCADARLHS